MSFYARSARWIAVAALAGCTGSIGGGVGSTASGGAAAAGSSGSGPSGAGGAPAPGLVVEALPPPASLARLTNEQYRNALLDLFGLGAPVTALDPDGVQAG